MIIEVKARLSEGNVTAGDFVLNLTPTATFTDSQHQHCGLWQSMVPSRIAQYSTYTVEPGSPGSLSDCF